MLLVEEELSITNERCAKMTHQVRNNITITPGSKLVIRQTLPQLFMVVNLSIHLTFNTNPTNIKKKKNYLNSSSPVYLMKTKLKDPENESLERKKLVIEYTKVI